MFLITLNVNVESYFFNIIIVKIKKHCIFAIQNGGVGIMNRKLKAKKTILKLNRGIEQ